MVSSAATDYVFSRWGRLQGPGGRDPLTLSGDAPAVLALHGYGGTVREVELVLDAARDAGLAAAAPLLPGHGTHAEDLAASRWPHWYDAAHDALVRLTHDGRPAIVVGLSLGSLLAVHLTVFHPARVCAVGLLANAFWLNPTTDLVLRATDRFALPNLWTPKLASDIGDAEMRANHTTYRVQPLHPALEVLRAGERSRQLVRRVHVPVLLAHGARDRVCPPSNLDRVARRLPHPAVHVLCLPRSRHVITRDLDRQTLRAALLAFFTRVRERLS